MRQRLNAWLGTAIACWLALVGSLWGWLPHLIDMPYLWFLAATTVMAVALGWLISRP